MTASLAGRARRSLVARTRTAGRHAAGRLAQLRRIAQAPGDRTRSPAGPAATVFEPHLGPRAMARAGHPGYFAGGSRRFATCTGVAWTRPDRLVSAFLLGSALVTYAFEDHADQPRIRHLATAVEPTHLGWPESLAAAPDGRWMAVADSISGRCLVLRVDPTSGSPDPVPATWCGVPGDANLHGVTIAPDGRSMLFTCIDEVSDEVPDGGSIRCVPVTVDPGEILLGPVTETPNPRPRLRPKAVAISPDGRFVAVGYGPNVTKVPVLDHPPAVVDVHLHDPRTGIGERVGSTPGAWLRGGSVECAAWAPDGRRLAVTDQAGDQVLIIDVDPTSGGVTGLAGRIGWAAGRLSFPHGCAFSPDGRWLAVTNYGDGGLRIYRTGP